MMWYDYVFGAVLIALCGFSMLLVALVGMNEREDDGDICILRKCVNAIHFLNDCYEPREEVAHWVNNQNGTYTCDHCGRKHSKTEYCPFCGFKMAAGVEEEE